jgi:hypothetical protein
VAHEIVLFREKTAAYELFAAHNFRYKNHTQGVEITCDYVRTRGNNELQKASLKKNKVEVSIP